MKTSSKAEQVKATQDRDMAVKEYQILEETVGRSDTIAYSVAGIFLGALFTASAILVPKLAQANSWLQLIAYGVVSGVLLLCSWFWFCGIHLRWRALNAITYQRLTELEEHLGFQRHTRIDLLYESQAKGHEWPEDKEPKWHKELKETLRPFTPWPPNITKWLCAVVATITLTYIMTGLLALCRLAEWIRLGQ